MQWLDGAQIEQALEQTFKRILTTRMLGMPLLNPALSVRALGFGRVNQDWLGVLITPWCMNLLLLPTTDSAWTTQAPGGKFEQAFPYGSFEFTVAREAQLGTYAQCSLFSPMLHFADQAAAFTAGQSVLQALLSQPAPRAVSRRDMLRGQFGGR
ncbi:[NiFe]-hydrogenase assembly chaperone HybE [Methylomonas sp. SURF-2]|uniref:[NiFe]-hydrogenase assembly chaperone HybE n=1 Tax=Methylomonas subterranea TaxID=2952225 RepID=A0ABT1TLS2_9GAMM|nr:[NiFe]-hydrogenase assembly chaperone HybE [Methylomonas sp. SURF-2]MCQ8106171.1 [NiFe]-hydrogenase assembly chaperone HybE [Methylomonas sp. SURF-2]